MPYFSDTDTDTAEADSVSTPLSSSVEPPSPVAGEKSCRPAIATMSLGKAGLHPLDKKLEAAASKGFQGIEVFWDDLDAYAQSMSASPPLPVSTRAVTKDVPFIVVAAQKIRRVCDKLSLEVLSVQPFRNYDGITDPILHEQRISEFKIWLAVAHELGAECIGVPSTIEPNDKTHTGDPRVIARDIRQLAELADPYGIRIAYENLCFAAHIRSWTQAWDVISRARVDDVDNIVFLPDTFNICGDIFADPTAPGGQAPNGDTALALSLSKLIHAIPLRQMPILQVADAELMDPPLDGSHDWLTGCFNAKMAWSRNARLFPHEHRGYLPVTAAVAAFAAAGWAGWVSMEVFSRSTAVPGEGTIWEHAERAWRGWEVLAGEMGCEMRPGDGAGMRLTQG